MKKKLLRFFSIVISLILMYSCGPSSESQRDQEISDSIRLDQERKELLERANKVLESSPKDTVNTEINTSDQ